MRVLADLTARRLLAALHRDCVVVRGTKYRVEDSVSEVRVVLANGEEDDGLVVYRADRQTLVRDFDMEQFV